MEEKEFPQAETMSLGTSIDLFSGNIYHIEAPFKKYLSN